MDVTAEMVCNPPQCVRTAVRFGVSHTKTIVFMNFTIYREWLLNMRAFGGILVV